MSESSKIALVVARQRLRSMDVEDADFFEKNELHMHVPEGSTPKDGPSAGITMVSALVSLALQQAVPPDMAMTGEVTLTGRVLKVGGIKEKTIAARREAAKVLVLPRQNLR